MIKIAIDTGGTFTDYTSAGTFRGKESRKIVKNPTDHQDPARGILAGLEDLAAAYGAELKELLAETEQICHGTTLALNALLEAKGAKTALFTTAGFRDALEVRLSALADPWDLRAQNPRVLVPRRLRLGIEERVDYRGEEIRPLDEDSVRAACGICRAQQVEAVAICFLFSFLQPAHEERAAAIVRQELPGVFVTVSSAVAPRIREYERTVTTVLNAYITPVLSDYLDRLQNALAAYGWDKPLHIMANNGGLTDRQAVGAVGVKTLLSGPAGGTVGTDAIGALLGREGLVLADMGGTSFDVYVGGQGENVLLPQSEPAGYPLTIPMADIRSIGAGGGSIAAVDAGGHLTVGPQSAGSLPGPACYGKGGSKATVTDAALLLGLIQEDRFLNGHMRLSRSLAEQALTEEVAGPLGITAMEAAVIVYRVAAAKMADAVRLLLTEKGRDPRQCSLLAAGGAFALFAPAVMKSLSMAAAIIPMQGPGFCSWGMLGAVCRWDGTRSFFMEKEQFAAAALNDAIAALAAAGNAEMERLGVPADRRVFSLHLEMRYVGQHHEIDVPWEKEGFAPEDQAALGAAFHRRHRALYEYAEEELAWEIIHLHLAGYERDGGADFFPFAAAETASAQKRLLPGNPFGLPEEAEVSVYEEKNMPAAAAGPALIVLNYTTVLVPAGFTFRCAREKGIITLYKEEASDE